MASLLGRGHFFRHAGSCDRPYVPFSKRPSPACWHLPRPAISALRSLATAHRPASSGLQRPAPLGYSSAPDLRGAVIYFSASLFLSRRGGRTYVTQFREYAWRKRPMRERIKLRPHAI